MTACSLVVRYHFTNLRDIIPEDLSHKLAIAQLVKKLRDVYGTQRSTNIFIRARHLTVPWARWTQPSLISLRFVWVFTKLYGSPKENRIDFHAPVRTWNLAAWILTDGKIVQKTYPQNVFVRQNSPYILEWKSFCIFYQKCRIFLGRTEARLGTTFDLDEYPHELIDVPQDSSELCP
jgi:hypothetical protein